MLTQLRWTAYGLRGRIVGAVLVTTVATLAIAAVGLLPRLETSLRNASLKTLQNDVKRAKTEIAKVGTAYQDYRIPPPHAAPEAGHNDLLAALTRVRDRLGATVVLVGYIDQTGQGTPVLDAHDPDAIPSAEIGAIRGPSMSTSATCGRSSSGTPAGPSTC